MPRRWPRRCAAAWSNERSGRINGEGVGSHRLVAVPPLHPTGLVAGDRGGAVEVEENHTMAVGDLRLRLLFGQHSHIGGRCPLGNHDSVMLYRAIPHAAMVPNQQMVGGGTRRLIRKRDPGVFNLSVDQTRAVGSARFLLEHKGCG